jgi:hypothetical protein
MALKIRWRVSPAPTGRFKSFQPRGWPHAEYPCGKAAGFIAVQGGMLSDSYNGVNAKRTDLSLQVYVAEWSNSGNPDDAAWNNRRLKARFKTLQEAKEALSRFLEANSTFRPPEYRDKEKS